MASRTLVLYVAIVLALTFNSVCFGEQVLAPELAIKSYGSIVEGRSIRLEVMVDFHSDQAPVGFTLEDVEWDLDGDQVFGEDGASASRGSELGRMVSLALSELQGASTVGVRVKASLSVDSQQFNLEAQTDLSLINAAPEVLIGSSEFQAIGSVASLSASCRDPGQDESFVEWDLDNDGIFGEEGLEALGGNERGSSVQFTTSVDATNSRVARVRARCQDVEKATGRIQSSNVLIPELQRSCNCAIPKGIPYNQMHLLGAAKFDKKTNKANVLLTSGSHPSSGAVFYPTPLTVTDNGIELCAKYQLSSLQNIPSKHAGSFSIIFTSSIPSSDVIESAHSSGLTIQFSESAEPSLVFFNPTGISQSSVSLKYPTLSRNSHYLSLRHRNGRTTVWIDGIELIDTEFALFPVSVVSRANNVYYGFSADSKAGALPVFAVEATTRVCSIPQI